MLSKLADKEYFRRFAAESIYEDGIFRDIAKLVAKSKPAPGKATLDLIKQFIAKEPVYRDFFEGFLGRVFDHEGSKPGGIQALDGQEFWY